MPRLLFLLLVNLLLVAQTAWGQSATDAAPLCRHEFSQPQMGTLFRIVLYASDSALAHSAAQAAFRRVDELNRILSDYLPDSELSRLSSSAGSGQAVPVSPDLWHLLHLSKQASQRSQGAFDITAGPYVSLWRRSRRQLQLPSAEALEQARQAVGYENLQLGPQRRTAQLLVPGMKLDMGGIGKGYAVDEALKVLQQHGISSALVDGGGNVVVSRPPPGKTGWRVAIGQPGTPALDSARFVSLACAAVATSGDLYQYVELDGKRYSHIVNPRTGLGLTHQRQVTIIACNGTTADWLSTAVSVLEPQAGRRLVRRTDGAEAIIFDIEKGGAKHWESRRFRKRR